MIQLNITSKQKQGDAGSVNTEAISKERHKELATEETSSVEELLGDTNFQPIDDINVLKENTPTSSDQVLPRVTQDVVRGLCLGSDVFPLPPLDRVGQLHVPNSFLKGTRDEKISLNNYLHRLISNIDTSIKPKGKKRKAESVILSLTEVCISSFSWSILSLFCIFLTTFAVELRLHRQHSGSANGGRRNFHIKSASGRAGGQG